MAYFQFDGVSNDANKHRHISNLFDVKLKAIEVLYDAGIDITPVTTVVNGVNDKQVGPLLDFLLANCDKMGGISFQPVSFTGRDENITDEDRRRQRYTISHMAHEMKRYYGGKIDPYRDWYPLGAMGGFTVLADHLRALNGPDQPSFGGLARPPPPNFRARGALPAQPQNERRPAVTPVFPT